MSNQIIDLYPAIVPETEHLFIAKEHFPPFEAEVNGRKILTAPIEAGRELDLIQMVTENAGLDRRISIYPSIQVGDVVLRFGQDTFLFNVQDQPRAQFLYPPDTDYRRLEVQLPLVLRLHKDKLTTTGHRARTLVMPHDGAIIVVGQLDGYIDLESGKAQFKVQILDSRVFEGGDRIEDLLTRKEVMESTDHYLTLKMTAR